MGSIIGLLFIWSYFVDTIARDKRGYPHNIFLFLDENICCGYSLEAPRQGTSNEYMSTHNMFLLRNKKDISSFQMKKVPYLLLWILIIMERSHSLSRHIRLMI